MRLFISDSFWEKLTELPRKVQQDVIKFQKNFRNNSRSLSIHLEPIPEFKDSTLHSARISGAYRVILGMKGEDFVLLYVDKHDDAYRWGKNKRLEWNNHTESYQIIPVSINASEPEVQELTSAEKVENLPFDTYTDGQLLDIGVPKSVLEQVRRIKDLDDLDKASNQSHGYLPQDAFENLFALMDGEDIESIIRQVNEGKSNDGVEGVKSANNRRRFVEITSDEELAGMLSGDMEKWQIFLHPSQRVLVNCDFPGTVKVSGSAGTGKTIAAVHRLAHLVSQSESKVLFTTYTKALAENLVGLVEKFNLPSNRYKLLNIDKVLREVAFDLGLIDSGTTILDYEGSEGSKSKALWKEVLSRKVTEFEEDFLYDEYLDVIVYNNNSTLADYLKQSRVGRSKPLTRRQRAEIWSLKEEYESLKRSRRAMDRLELFNLASNCLNNSEVSVYTNVIVDEFQDFSNPELRFVRALVKEGRNDLFITGDPFQRIYSNRKINFSQAGINVRGKRSRKLKVNYRTTEEIKRMAVAVLKNVKYDDLDGGEENNAGYISIIHGNQPKYKVLTNSTEECNSVVDFIEDCIHSENGMRLNEICVTSIRKGLYKDVLNTVHRKGIPYQEIKNGKMVGNKEGVVFSTFHSLKGLEFRAISIVGVTEASLPSSAESLLNVEMMDVLERRETLSQVRSSLYVAITRGRQAVLLTGYGEPCKLLAD